MEIPRGTDKKSWSNQNKASTSKAAFFRAQSATFEHIFRAQGSSGDTPKDGDLPALPMALDRASSSVFRRALSFSGSLQQDDLIQRSQSFVLRRHVGNHGAAKEEEKTNDNFTINGKELEQVGENALRFFYYSDWSPAAVHYSLDSEESWTVAPGVMMVEAKEADLPKLHPVVEDIKSNYRLWVMTIPHAPNGMVFVPNDNGKRWDHHPSKNNYCISEPGSYILKNGEVTRLCLPPGQPIILVERDVGVQEVELSWNPPIEGEADVAGYNIYRNDEKIGSLTIEEIIGIDNLEATPVVSCFNGFRRFVDANLMGSSTYRYSVTAYNENMQEGDPSAPITVKTREPDRPGPVENVWIEKTGKDFVDVCWQTPGNMGGGFIEAYRIFRDGKECDVVPSASSGDHHYLDRDVEHGAIYCYHVTASLSLSGLRERNKPYFDDEGGETKTNENDISSSSVITAPKLKVYELATSVEGQKWKEALLIRVRNQQLPKESDALNGVFGEARVELPLPKLFESKSHILLQSFNWRSCHNKISWYKVLMSKIPKMKELGVTLLWLPPPSQSVAPQGYMPSKLYNLNSAYGSEEDIRKLTGMCQDNGVYPMVDFVANHRCGSKQDEFGQWTVFEDPPWGPWAICADNRQGYHAVSTERDSGASSDCAPDINHRNQQVQKDYKEWIRWLFDDVGFKAIRIDMAPGYGVNHQLDYMSMVDNPFVVGEYWSGDVNTLRNYIHKAQRKISVYDFAFYYVLRRCVETGCYGEMRRHDGKLNGLLGEEPGLAVTFLDNHDTEHLDFVGKFAQGDQRRIMLGYAILLTHPGTPSIYWNHFSDYGDSMTQKLVALGNLRQEARVTSTSKIEIIAADRDCYVTKIYGDMKSHSDAKTVYLKIGNSGHNPGNGWQHRCHGDGYQAWISQ